MRNLGRVFVGLLGAGALGGAALAVMSIPDIKRYVSMRRM